MQQFTPFSNFNLSGHSSGKILLVVISVLMLWHYGITPKYFLMLFFLAVLYRVSVTDIYERKIPNRVLLAAVLVRLAYFLGEQAVQAESLLFPAGPEFWHALFRLCMDGLSVSLPLLLLTLAMEKTRKKALMGGGDLKLLFVTGLYVGWERNLLAVFLACIVSLVVLLVQAWTGKSAVNASVPFGPSIAAGAVLAVLSR